jgi:hypothetical protein
LPVSNVTTTGVLPSFLESSLRSCQAARFDVDEDKGARVVVCGEQAQAELLASYYIELGRDNPLFFSHVERRGSLVFQMNGELPTETFQQYVAVLP